MSLESIPVLTTEELIQGLNLSLDSCSANRMAANDPRHDNSGELLIGGRNNALASTAGIMRYQGKEESEINAVLQKMNLARCNPPLDSSEVSRIAHSISQYSPSLESAHLNTLHDVGNAKRLALLHGQNIRFVPEWSKWIIWNGKRWAVDIDGVIVEFAKLTAASIHSEAFLIQDKAVRDSVIKHAHLSHNAARITKMIELAQSDPSLVLSAKDIDADPLLLAVENGVIDLRTLSHRPVRPEDYISSLAPVSYDPNAQCPRFIQFLDEVTGGDKRLQTYLQRVVGYCLTGLTREQVFFFMYGGGANGKSTFMNVLRSVLGEHLAKQTSSDTLMSRYGGRTSTNDLARLQHARLAVASEIEEGSHFDEPMIKQMTGGEQISCRYLYGEFFEYTPQYKIMIAGNHKPVIKGGDDGIWRRLHMIPFTQTIDPAKRDKHLQQTLAAELPGILNWALWGVATWTHQGLNPPRVVTDAINEYRTEMDLIGQWILDRCVLSPTESCLGEDLHSDYKDWCIRAGLNPISRIAWSKKMKARGLQSHRTANGIEFTGIDIT